MAHSLVSEAAAPAQKKGEKRDPQPKVDKGYNGSGIPWKEYKEDSKKFSQAVADKELTVRKAAEDALASGVKISKTTIARHAKDHPGTTPEQKGAEALIPRQILAHEAATIAELRKQKLPVFNKCSRMLSLVDYANTSVDYLMLQPSLLKRTLQNTTSNGIIVITTS